MDLSAPRPTTPCPDVALAAVLDLAEATLAADTVDSVLARVVEQACRLLDGAQARVERHDPATALPRTTSAIENMAEPRLLRLPLCHGTTLLGILEVQRAPDAAGFEAADRRLLQALARQAAVAIVHAQRLATERAARQQAEAERDLVRRAARDAGVATPAGAERAGAAGLAVAVDDRDWLRAVLDQLPEGVIVADARGQVTIANRAALALAARHDPTTAPTDAYGNPMLWECCRADGSPYPLTELPLERALRAGEVVSGDEEVHLRQADGSLRPVLASAAPLQGAGGEGAGAVVVFQDISHLKEVDRLKDEFLAVAAHELRTPLTTIKGYAQLLARCRLANGDVRPLLGIVQQVDRMAELIDDLLDLVRLNQSCLELRLREVDLVALVRRFLEQQRAAAPAHTFELAAEVPTLVGHWDEGRLEQVVAHLLDNAVRYSPEGGTVHLAVRRVDEAAGPAAELVVADAGIGIAAEDLPHVFERFRRGANFDPVNVAGLGLGLFLCREIISRHGGHIWLESAGAGWGTTATVRLPLAPGAPA